MGVTIETGTQDDGTIGSPLAPAAGVSSPASSSVVLGRLTPVLPRQVWKHEAYDFTPWLLANADVLGELLGMDLELHEAEHTVGDFSLDLLGKDVSTGETVIVENQLEQSDHLHLGQILTYAAGTDPVTIVWVNTGFRPEHRAALDWLNERTTEKTRFFGVEINVVRIGNSEPAPAFRLVAQPNDWEKVVRQTVTSVGASDREARYEAFWTLWRDAVREKHPSWSNSQRVPRQQWFQFSAGVSGVNIIQAFTRHGLAVQFQFEGPDAEQNLARYRALESRREAIEAAYRAPLTWEPLESRKSARVAIYHDPGVITDTEAWDSYLTWFMEHTERLKHAVESTGGVPSL